MLTYRQLRIGPKCLSLLCELSRVSSIRRWRYPVFDFESRLIDPKILEYSAKISVNEKNICTQCKINAFHIAMWKIHLYQILVCTLCIIDQTKHYIFYLYNPDDVFCINGIMILVNYHGQCHIYYLIVMILSVLYNKTICITIMDNINHLTIYKMVMYVYNYTLSWYFFITKIMFWSIMYIKNISDVLNIYIFCKIMATILRVDEKFAKQIPMLYLICGTAICHSQYLLCHLLNIFNDPYYMTFVITDKLKCILCPKNVCPILLYSCNTSCKTGNVFLKTISNLSCTPPPDPHLIILYSKFKFEYG